MDLFPTPADYRALLALNPIAAEQLKSIVLERMLNERDAELAELKVEPEDSEAAD